MNAMFLKLPALCLFNLMMQIRGFAFGRVQGTYLYLTAYHTPQDPGP